jgi:hypothetical protein
MRSQYALVGFFFAGSLFSQDVQPRVVSSGKGWFRADDSRLLLRDDRLAVRDRLTGGKDGGELILDCGQRGWFTYRCESGTCTNVHVCAETNDGGAKVERAPLLAHLTEMRVSLVRREPAELAVAGVRGEGGPSDAVVMLTPQGVHWAPVLGRVLEGRYCFRLAHLPAASAGPFRTFTLDWDKTVEKEGIAPVANLIPGLYGLEKGVPGTNANCRLDANVLPVWVLVVPSAAFDAVNKQWDDDSNQVDELEQSGAATSVLMTLRHAVLAWLADSVEKK